MAIILRNISHLGLWLKYVVIHVSVVVLRETQLFLLINGVLYRE